MRVYYEEKGIKIYHGDCREVLPTISPLIDLVLTDPPYGIDWSRGVNNARDSKAHDGIVGDEDTTVRDAALALALPLPCIVFGSFYASYPKALKQVLIWHKPSDAGVVGSTTGFRRDAEPIFLIGEWPMRCVKWSSIIRSRQNSISSVATETGHPHTKPLDLITWMLTQSPAGTVADPFMGSGTTLRAAKDLGRQAIGIEIEERYCEIAANRLRQSVMNF